MPASAVSTYEERREWRRQQLDANDKFVVGIPKIELHVHIEGTMTPELRWKLSVGNRVPLTVGLGPKKTVLDSVEKVEQIYKQIRGRIGAASANAAQSTFTFFEAYYGGFELLQTEQDYYDLAMNYFERAAQMNVRYCEPFFDIQGHTRRGIPVSVVMAGFRRAQLDAEKRLNVKSQWIMCMLRDMSPESAMQNYIAALPCKDMIVGIGLDSDEKDRPPLLFQELFSRARADGFKLTSHCDFHQKDTHEHIRQVASQVGGSDGADRIDHGMNATDRAELMELIKRRDIGMTVCPCAYIRHQPLAEVFPRIRKLFDAGIKVTIASDDPAYMEDNWVLHNLLMARDRCNFTNEEMAQLQRNAVSICWATEDVKLGLSRELDSFVEHFV